MSADVPEPAADSGRGEPVGCGGFLPVAAEVFGERTGKSELGVSDDQNPGPAVRGFGGTEFRGGPAEGLLREAEGAPDRSDGEKPARSGLRRPG